MMDVINQSKTDEIQIYKMRPNNEYFLMKFSVNGKNYVLKTHELEKLEHEIA